MKSNLKGTVKQSSSEVTVFRMFCCHFPNCGKEYNEKFNLKRHIEYIHTKSKETVCEICSKVFRNKENLRVHSYIHEDLKPLKCEVCGELFRHHAALKFHRFQHTSVQND